LPTTTSSSSSTFVTPKFFVSDKQIWLGSC